MCTGIALPTYVTSGCWCFTCAGVLCVLVLHCLLMLPVDAGVLHVLVLRVSTYDITGCWCFMCTGIALFTYVTSGCWCFTCAGAARTTNLHICNKLLSFHINDQIGRLN